jgi:hypothetical protein
VASCAVYELNCSGVGVPSVGRLKSPFLEWLERVVVKRVSFCDLIIT